MNIKTYAEQVIENANELNMDFQDSREYFKNKIEYLEMMMELNPTESVLQAVLDLKQYMKVQPA